MKENLFRAKRIDNGEWAEGVIWESNGSAYIIDENRNFIEVVPKTAGMVTGMYDNNGSRIFEGDVVKFGRKEPVTIAYSYEMATFVGMDKEGYFSFPLFEEVMSRREVLGNVYDDYKDYATELIPEPEVDNDEEEEEDYGNNIQR